MDKILDIVNGWITAAVASEVLQIKQILLFIFIAGPLALVIWKIREIINFVNEVRNSKLNELQHLLDSHKLSDEVNICVEDEITRIIGYRMTGNDSNLLIVFYVQIMPDDFVMQLHRF